MKGPTSGQSRETCNIGINTYVDIIIYSVYNDINTLASNYLIAFLYLQYVPTTSCCVVGYVSPLKYWRYYYTQFFMECFFSEF